MVKITSLLSCAMLLFFVVLENSLLAIENNVLLVQQNKTVNGITFSITNAKVLDSDAVSTLVVYKKVNYKRQVLDVVVAYSVGMPNSFYCSNPLVKTMDFQSKAFSKILRHVPCLMIGSSFWTRI